MRTLKKWFREVGNSALVAFPNTRNGKLSRSGVDYLLKQVVHGTVKVCPSLSAKKYRRILFGTAMHLLQSGVNITVIALWLGHGNIETTHIYVEADLATKERALNHLSPAGAEVPRFKPSDKVMEFLARL